MATRLVVNPASGDGSGVVAAWARRLDDHGVAVDRAYRVDEAGWGAGLSGGDRLLVAGGDGTVNGAAEACMASGATLGVLPAGTANDFARSLGVPLDPAGACRVIAADARRRVDVGRVGSRLFLNVVHVGLGAEVAPGVPAAHKRRWRHLGYLRTLAARLRGYRGFRARISPTGPGNDWQGRWLEIAVANGHCFGGGQEVDEVRVDDGLLDLVAVRPRPPLRLLGLWLRARLTGRMPAGPALVRSRGTGFRVFAHHPRPVSADGEACGTTPVELTVLPGALRVLAPPGAGG